MCQSKCAHKTMKAIGLMGLRLVIGGIFIYMGYQKLGPNHAGTEMLMSGKLGLPGNATAYFVGALELLGGLMVLFGVYAKYAAAWLSVILLVALIAVHRGGPTMGYFLPLSMLGGTFALMGVGAGPWRLVKTQCHCKDCSGMGQGGCCGGKKEGGSCCGGSMGAGMCSCKGCCGGKCGCGAPNGQCSCCKK